MVIVSVPVEDKLDEDKKPPVDLKPSVPTGDSSQMMLMVTMLLVSGSYLELRRKNG